MNKPIVLVAARDEDLCHDFAERLRCRGFELLHAPGRAAVLAALVATHADLAIVGALPDWDELEALREIHERDRRVPLILVTRKSSEAHAIAALRAGASDYLKCPVTMEELLASMDRCLRALPLDGESAAFRTPAAGSHEDPRLLGVSPALRRINQHMLRLASSDSIVLITGETGTGKDLLADLIHRNSPRRGRPFVCIDCAALPENLAESELFGYERGAFTGAHSRRQGQLELANGGTVFLDEIGDMSPQAQAKILRAIESRSIQRIGGRRPIALDIRVIAATNRDLERSVADNEFRKDLYYRLNVARIHLPPLRERKEDIPVLLDHYLAQFNRRYGRRARGFEEEALACLLRHDWPGNVRELRNLLEVVLMDLDSERVAYRNLPESFRRDCEARAHSPDEREVLLCALVATRWNKSKAAEKLHWSRMTLYRKMEKYQIREAPDSATDTH